MLLTYTTPREPCALRGTPQFKIRLRLLYKTIPEECNIQLSLYQHALDFGQILSTLRPASGISFQQLALTFHNSPSATQVSAYVCPSNITWSSLHFSFTLHAQPLPQALCFVLSLKSAVSPRARSPRRKWFYIIGFPTLPRQQAPAISPITFRPS